MKANLWLVMGFVLFVNSGFAQPSGSGSVVLPVGTPVQAGPYRLRVEYLNSLTGGKDLEFRMQLEQGTFAAFTARVRAVPGTSVDAVPVQATLRPVPNAQNALLGTIHIPVRGLWLLDVYLNGPRGEGIANVPVLASTPATIPTWLGWLIGLMPVFAVFGFIVVRARQPAPTFL
jgi:hypothetical protein